MAVIMRAAAILTGPNFPSPGISATWWQPGTVGGSTADATDILARFRASWNSFAARFSDSITVDFDPICLAVEATTGVLTGAFAGTDPLSVVGTNVGDLLPRQTQGLCRFGTSSVIDGRRVRGRLFLPGPVETDNLSTGLPNSTYVSGINTAFGSMLSPGATSSALCVWHRPKPGIGGGAAATVNSVSGAATWSVLRSRRS